MLYCHLKLESMNLQGVGDLYAKLDNRKIGHKGPWVI